MEVGNIQKENYNLTKEEAKNYLSKLEPMTNEEIKKFLEIPIKIKNNVIVDGTHRCCSMMGRLIKGQEYIEINV